MPTPAVAQSLAWRAGDPARVTVHVVDADGEPVSLAGSTWTAQVRQDRERDVLATMTTDATDAAAGVLVFTLSGEQTRAVRDAGGSSPHIDVEGSAHGTLVAMRAVIERDVTRVPDGEGGIVEPTGGLGDVLDLLLTGTTVEVVAQSVVAFAIGEPGGPGGGSQTAAEVPFAPAGTIEATDVQAAIVELDSDLVTEATARAAADTALSDSLTTEQVVRADADTALDGRVDALEAIDPLVTGDIGTTVQAHSPVLDATTAPFTLAAETKLDGIAEGAEVNAVASVEGRTGAVSLSDLYDAAGSAAAAEAAANTYTDTAVDNATSGLAPVTLIGSPMQSGQDYSSGRWPGGSVALTGMNGTCLFVPWLVSAAGTVERAYIEKTVNSTDIGAVARVGLYAAGSDGLPTGSPLSTFGTMSLATGAGVILTGFSFGVAPGLYWKAFSVEGMPTSAASMRHEETSPMFASLFHATATLTAAYHALAQSGVTAGSLPVANPSASSTIAPRILLRAT